MRKILEHIKESYINKDTKGYRGIVSFGRNVTKRGEMWTLKEGSMDFRVHNHMTQYSPNNQKGCSGSHIKKKKKKKKKEREKGFGFTWIWALWVLFITMPRDKSSKLGMSYYLLHVPSTNK